MVLSNNINRIRREFLITVFQEPFLPQGDILIIEETLDQEVPILLIEIALLLGEAAFICGELVFALGTGEMLG